MIFFQQLRAVQQMRGYKRGWAAHKFKDKFGHFPPWSYDALPPAAPTDAADGMVEDIITGLSRIKWLFVIARNSTFTYKGRAIDVKQVGRELGVRYVLEGSVRKAADRVRVSGQLIDAATGAHVWAQRFDRRLEDIFALQDEITLNVVGAIEPSLRDAEIERAKRKRPDSLDAYDLVLRAIPHVYLAMPEEAAKALPLLEQALVLDPSYAGVTVG
jgi:adenylate cyclase